MCSELFCGWSQYFACNFLLLCGDSIILPLINICMQLFHLVQWLHHFMHDVIILCNDSIIFTQSKYFAHEFFILCSDCIIFCMISTFCVQIFHYFVRWLHNLPHNLNILHANFSFFFATCIIFCMLSSFCLVIALFSAWFHHFVQWLHNFIKKTLNDFKRLWRSNA